MEDVLAASFGNITAWLNRIDFIKIITIVILAYVVCKITGPIVGWITRRAIASRHHSDDALVDLERSKRTKTVADLFSFIIKTMIVITAVYTVLTKIGINLAPLMASAGIAGVALGFGAQQVVKDILAGFFILMENQFRVDDVIRVSGVGFPSDPVEGTVQSITLRKTTLRDRDGNVHIIPNGQIAEVTNRTLGFSKFRFTFAVAVGTDVEEIIQIINDTGEKMLRENTWHKVIVDAPHYDEFGRIGKEGLNVTVSGTTMPGYQWKVSAEFRKRLVAELQKSDIMIADVEWWYNNIMLMTIDRLIGAPVMSLQTGLALCSLAKPIINPHNLSIVAFWVEGPRLDFTPAVIFTEDIREFASLGAIVDSVDNIMSPVGMVRLNEVINYDFNPIGCRVVDINGNKLGRVSDCNIDLNGFKIQHITIKPPGLRRLSSAGMVVNRSQITKVEPGQITVDDTKMPVNQPNVSAVKFNPEIDNPFRRQQPASVDVVDGSDQLLR